MFTERAGREDGTCVTCILYIENSSGSKGGWVGHTPQIFGWRPVCPPSFVLNLTFMFV